MQVPLVESPVVSHFWPCPQGEQAAPAVPHDVGDSVPHAWHVPSAAQHPFGHEFASHTQFPAVLHSCPEGQAAQATPLAPHDVFDCPE